MAGMLYDTPVGVLSQPGIDPRSAMLMQMGMGLLSQGPSTTPVSFGSQLGKAGMQGLQAFSQAQQANQQQQLFALKMAEEQRAAEERRKKEESLNVILNDPKFAPYAPLIRAGHLGPVIERVMPKPKEPQNPFSRLNPKDYTRDSLVKFQETGNVADLVPAPEVRAPQESELSRLLRERNALPPGSPDRPLYDEKIKKLTTHAPAPSATATVSMPRGDQKYLETRLTNEAQDIQKLYSAADSAMRSNAALDRIAANNEESYAGALAPIMANAANLFSSFGFTSDRLTSTAGIQQAASEMLANRMSELGARGLTDKDMQILRDNFPKVESSREARAMVVSVLKKANEGTILEAQQRRQQELTQYPELRSRTRKFNWEDYKPGMGDRKVVRRGKYLGRTVVEYSDGSIEYEK